MLAALVQAHEAAISVQTALTESEAEAQAAAERDFNMVQALEIAERIRSSEDDAEILKQELAAAEQQVWDKTIEAAAHRRRRRRRRR